MIVDHLPSAHGLCQPLQLPPGDVDLKLVVGIGAKLLGTASFHGVLFSVRSETTRSRAAALVGVEGRTLERQWRRPGRRCHPREGEEESERAA